MRRSASLVLLLLILFLMLALGPAGCGGGGGVGPAAVVTLTPAPLSLNEGQLSQLTATVTDVNGASVTTETLTFSSNAPNIASVSTAGQVCGGSWDSTFIHCTPGPVGTATITATASPSGIVSSGITVYVHQRADSIVVGESFPVAVPLTCGVPVPPAAGCISSGATVPNNTARYTALACSNDPAVCAPGAPPCALDSNTLGPLTFASTSNAVATLAPDVTNPNFVAIATAVGPGQANITATLSNTTSLPAQFVSCPPKSIVIHVPSQPTTTTVSVAKGSTAALEADVVDANGITLPALALAWSTSIPAVATVSSGGTVIGVAPGSANVVAACTPPSCNAGSQQSIYSNVVSATVTGTTNTTTVYATSSDAGTTTIVPIATATNTAGTAINLPGGFAPPNSFIFANNGLKGYLGSDSGLIILDPVAATTTGIPNVRGKVLAVTPDGSQALIVDTTIPNTVYLFNASGGTTTYTVPGATAADFTQENTHLFIVAHGATGDRVFEIANGIFNNLPASGPPAGVALLASGAFAYVGDSATDVFSTCTNGQVGNVGIASTLIKAAAKPVPPPNEFNLQMIAVTGNQITQIDAAPAPPGSPCAAIPTNTAQAYPFPSVPAFTPVQLFVTPDSSHAVVTASDVGKLLVYTIGTDAASGSASTIDLANSATGSYTGGVTVDSSTVWVGVAGVNQVQAFNLASGTPIAQVSVGFSPKLVAVRYQ